MDMASIPLAAMGLKVRGHKKGEGLRPSPKKLACKRRLLGGRLDTLGGEIGPLLGGALFSPIAVAAATPAAGANAITAVRLAGCFVATELGPRHRRLLAAILDADRRADRRGQESRQTIGLLVGGFRPAFTTRLSAGVLSLAFRPRSFGALEILTVAARKALPALPVAAILPISPILPLAAAIRPIATVRAVAKSLLALAAVEALRTLAVAVVAAAFIRLRL